MDDKLTTIYTAATPVQARMLQNLLDDEGIQAYLVNDSLQAAVGEVPFGWSTAVRVAVASPHAEQARGIAEEFEGRLAQKPAAGGPETSEIVTALWPECPKCGKPRTAVCEWCGTAGTRFPPADPEPAEGSGSVQAERWLCPTCDEPVEGRFLRWCEWCNHDFGAGVHAPGPRVKEAEHNLNPRLVYTALALTGLVVLLLLYFAIVLALNGVIEVESISDLRRLSAFRFALLIMRRRHRRSVGHANR